MDNIQKNLLKFSNQERRSVDILIDKIQSGEVIGLDIKKLAGTDDIFRLRKGSIRMIYRKHKNNKIEWIDITKRSEKTYRNF